MCGFEFASKIGSTAEMVPTPSLRCAAPPALGSVGGCPGSNVACYSMVWCGRLCRYGTVW